MCCFKNKKTLSFHKVTRNHFIVKHKLIFLLCLMIIFLSDSAGPQKCASCIQEGIYEEGISILETSSVRKNALKKA